MSELSRQAVAEAVATFALCFIGAGAILTDRLTGGGVGLLGIAFAHGLVLAIMVSATMNISGGHVNPAVTIAILIAGKIRPSAAVVYIVSQLVGGAIAGFLLLAIFPPAIQASVHLGTPALASGVSFGQGVLIEAVLTFFLVFAVFGTAVDKRAPQGIAGFGIGLVLVFDILMGGPLTGASMNPARSFGPALTAGFWDNHLVYWIGPILGGAIASIIYSKVLMTNKA